MSARLNLESKQLILVYLYPEFAEGYEDRNVTLFWRLKKNLFRNNYRI